MVKITILYTVRDKEWFDLSYYLEKHLPLSKSIFADVLKGIGIEENILSGSKQDDVASYTIIGHLFFEKIEDFYERFLPNQEVLYEDTAGYTNVTPTIQISKVLMWQTPFL